MTTCPVCLSIDGYECVEAGSWDVRKIRHECPVCGIFGTTWEAREDYLGPERSKATRYVRAALSHWTIERQAKLNRDDIPVVDSNLVEAAIKGDLSLPNPAEQAKNIVRFIGEKTQLTGEEINSMPPEFHSYVGSVSREFAVNLLFELRDRGLLQARESPDQVPDAYFVRLTLDGWNLFEAEQRGQTSSGYGFIALKFYDAVLDPFLRDHIKPAVRSLGMELRDMRDSAQAGIIDNLMRMQIRDSAFVLVDLTHDNPGAYWEAGYAEGMGKPVLYICEKSKFDAAKTHFDTNHCTTVIWDTTKPEEFKENLVATLKRSLTE